MTNMLLDFFDQRFSTAFEKMLQEDEKYLKADSVTTEILDALLELDLNNEQRNLVDKLVSAHNASANNYGQAAYQCGFHDAIKLIFLLIEIGKKQ